MVKRKVTEMDNLRTCVCFVALFVLIIYLTPSVTVAQSIFANPHGPYTPQTSGCAACHVAHSGLAPRLLNRSEMTVLCLACHDGSASKYNVSVIYDPAGSNNSFHPVVSTGNPYVGEILECSDCHNPHAQNLRLLRSTDGTSTFTGGPAFCLGCHGATARAFPRDTGAGYWARTAGNYTNPNAPAHYNTANPQMLPASGTNVTCVVCHAPHGAAGDALLLPTEEDLCLGCHKPADKANLKGHPVYYFDRTGSTHNVVRNAQMALGCTSCHGPHTVNNYMTGGADGVSLTCYRCHYPNIPAGGTREYNILSNKTVISDPRNTKKLFAGKPGTGLGGLPHTTGDLSDFCMSCHTGTPPQATKSSAEFVPYTVRFPAVNFTTNAGGWNKSGYKTTAHGTANPKITCANCHESHGSNFPALARYGEDTTTDNRMCLRCHNESTVTQKNIRADLLKTYRHPTLTVTDKHSNTENYQNMPLADRHAECADCHDPHQATNAVATAPAAGGTIQGVSGVKINYGSSVWATWPTGATFNFVSSVDNQYELCFKCHSYYSYGNNPPDSVSRAVRTQNDNRRVGGKQVDVAKEFNPNNAGYHAVVGGSKVGTFTASSVTYVYGRLNTNWPRATEWVTFSGSGSSLTQRPASGRSNARLYCTDCHASNTSGVKGPHGSVNPFILIRPWNPNTGSTSDQGMRGTGGSLSGNTSSHLCFMCHDYNFYAGGWTSTSNNNLDQGTSTRRSAFSEGTSRYNLHCDKDHEDFGCASCHGSVPHGFHKRSMLVEHRDGEPYASYSWLQLFSFRSKGNWTKGSCNHDSLASGGNPNSGFKCD